MARQFQKGIDYSVNFEARLTRLALKRQAGFDLLVDATWADMIELTSGTVSTAELRRLGHPFARGASVGAPSRLQRGARAPVARMRTLPINRQSGRLQKSLGKRKVGGKGPLTRSFDVGTVKGAGRSIYVLMPAGTRRMVARGFWREVHRRLKARRDGFVKYLQASPVT